MIERKECITGAKRVLFLSLYTSCIRIYKRLDIVKNCTLLLIFMASMNPILAQFDIATYQRLKTIYPGETIIKLNKEVNIDISHDGIDYQMERTRSEQMLYLKNTIGQNPEQSTYTSHFVELLDYEANSFVIEGDKYKKLNVNKYQEKTDIDGYIFHDDSKEYIFTFPGIGEGTITELKTTHKIHNPRMLTSLLLQEFYPIHNLKITIIFDKHINIKLVKRNIPENDYIIEESTKRGKKRITITKKHIKPIPFDEYQPDIHHFAPHVIPIITSYENNGKLENVLNTTDDLYGWYYTFIENLQEDLDHKALKTIVDEVTNENMSEFEKVEQLFYWIQRNIKYIAFEEGEGGFIPRKPNEVLSKRYGDCKDNTSLLHALLKVAGIDSYYTWIGTRDLPYSYGEFASPIIDNHMILSYKHKDTWYFLDGTGNYQNINVPTSFIQGKEALIAI
ncbi:MAG: DUF3857 domain-containing transglutaminase family protein, partial [Bacteroidales bacterium]|nr:DUF3857 domain-containing transglutaminase family protein [Bacteroidales bacterium]